MKLQKQIIQGDTYNAKIVIKKNEAILDHSLIDKVYFTCKGLNIQIEPQYDAIENAYLLEIPSSETQTYNIGKYDFDITILFVNQHIKTAVYEDVLQVLKKHNEVDYA